MSIPETKKPGSVPEAFKKKVQLRRELKPKRKPPEISKTESVDEYMARGGNIQILKPANEDEVLLYNAVASGHSPNFVNNCWRSYRKHGTLSTAQRVCLHREPRKSRQ